MGKATWRKAARRAAKQAQPPKPGRGFENRIGWIHRVIDESALVECRAWLHDKATGTQREQDVVIEVRADGFRVLTIIEAKDHKRRIDVGYIDPLPTRRSDLGADNIAMASTGGFTPAAIAKARAYGIRLFTYREDPDVSRWPAWMQTPALELSIEVRTSRTVAAECTVESGAPHASDLMLDGEIQLRALADRLLSCSPIDRFPAADESRLEFTLARPVWLRHDDDTWHLLQCLRVSVTHRDEAHECLLRRFVYSDAISGEPITDVFVGEGTAAGAPIWIDLAGIAVDGGASGHRLAMRYCGTLTGELASAQALATITRIGPEG